MDFELGISLDPAAVTQRHTLYDSDEEEEEIENAGGIFSVNLKAPISSGGVALLIAIGQTAAIFARSYFVLDSEPLCQITSDSNKVLAGRYFGSRQTAHAKEDDVRATVHVGEVYNAKRKSPGAPFLVCIFENTLKSEYCNLWAAKLFDHLKPDTVVILHAVPVYEYFSSEIRESDTGSFLSSLQTSSWPHTPLAGFLEPPNTVKGEAAAVLTYCQMYGVAASLAVLYTATSQSGAECIHSLLPLLQHPFIADGLQLKSEAEAAQLVKNLLPKPRHDLSTLYT